MDMNGLSGLLWTGLAKLAACVRTEKQSIAKRIAGGKLASCLLFGFRC
jgi:hypothetical protein